MILLKPGARIRGLKTEILFAILVVQEVHADYDLDCIVTSVTDGVHGHASKHYSGFAADFRTKHWSAAIKHQIVSVIKEALGADYDVVLLYEGEANEHLHVEYDPKVH